MNDPNESLEVRQARSQNALEVIKLCTEELNHYRSRLTHTVTSYSAMTLLVSGALASYDGGIRPILGYLLIVLLLALALWSSEVLWITRLRAARVRHLRQNLLETLDLPRKTSRNVSVDFDFSLGPTRKWGITALSWLIIIFVTLLPIIVIATKIKN